MPQAIDNPFRESARVLGHYVKAQFLIAAIVTVLYVAGFAVAGMGWWAVAGLLCGACYLVPHFGGLIALGVTALAGLFADLDLTHWMLVMAVWIVVQGIEGFILTPKILGERLGLRPLVVFLVVLVASFFLGPIALFVVVPALAVANVFWRYYRQARTS